MEKRGGGIGILFAVSAFVLLVMPFANASIKDSMSEIESYASQYNSGSIDAARLIIYIEYSLEKMYAELDKGNVKAFTEAEIKTAFDEKKATGIEKMKMMEQRGEMGGKFYEKIFAAKDFNIVFTANPFYMHTREYYETREEEAEAYFTIGYDIKPSESAVSDEELANDIKEFMIKLKSAATSNASDELDSLNKEFIAIKLKVQNANDCEKLMQNAFGVNGEDRGDDKFFTMKIMQENETRCYPDKECKPVCKQEQQCYNKCGDKEVCSDTCNPVCTPQQVCNDICTGENSTNCTTQCYNNETCTNTCTKSCHTEQQCADVCEPKEICKDECNDIQRCESMTSGELKIEGICKKDYYNDIYINAYGPTLQRFESLSKYKQETDCESRIEDLVKIRKAFQKSINDEFATWYFKEFIGNDTEKMVHGTSGIRKVLDILIVNDQEVSNNVLCAGMQKWPDGFEGIDVNYSDDNAHLEIWEKKIPVHGTELKYWTTLYKYSYMPNKELLKRLINYKMSEQGTFGPSAKDVARIRADEGKMELVNRLADKYGGSFDVKLYLYDGDEAVIKKYLRVNKEDVIKISDSIEGKEDISINVDYNSLYWLIHYFNRNLGGNEIKGPYWVGVRIDEGPGKFFSVVGALSKFWREGVKIQPRYAILKMFFNVKDISSLIQESQSSSSSEQSKETQVIKATGDVILEKD